MSDSICLHPEIICERNTVIYNVKTRQHFCEVIKNDFFLYIRSIYCDRSQGYLNYYYSELLQTMIKPFKNLSSSALYHRFNILNYYV